MRLSRVFPCVVMAATLAACDGQPLDPAPDELTGPASASMDLVEPPWANSWGDPIIGPEWLVGPLGFVPCTGEDMDYYIYWAVWGKVQETPSGNTIVNTMNRPGFFGDLVT
jgi:hypothetical protein